MLHGVRVLSQKHTFSLRFKCVSMMMIFYLFFYLAKKFDEIALVYKNELCCT